MVVPNKQRATQNGLGDFESGQGSAQRDMPFLRPATLFLAYGHSAHFTQNAMKRNKNGYIATARINVDRP
ncbi:MAG: hypothetical protein Q9M08_01695 [Mariprofundus sp.]|nr:hypothetical protein [Mariprofundus sp.]